MTVLAQLLITAALVATAIIYGTDVPTVDNFFYTPSGGSPTAKLAQQTPTSANSGVMS